MFFDVTFPPAYNTIRTNTVHTFVKNDSRVFSCAPAVIEFSSFRPIGRVVRSCARICTYMLLLLSVETKPTVFFQRPRTALLNFNVHGRPGRVTTKRRNAEKNETYVNVRPAMLLLFADAAAISAHRNRPMQTLTG